MTRQVGVLGATGAVGQKFIRLLDSHPDFEVGAVYASERSRGKRYAEAVHWLEPTPVPDHVADLEVRGEGDKMDDVSILFSAIPGGKAGAVERAFAAKGHAVFTNARDLRLEPDVPLVIGEVNADHLELVESQASRAESGGFVVANGNCTTILLAMVLKPLQDAFGLKRVNMVSMQALSGAGYPGVASLDILGNVVPFIPGEEEQVRKEAPRFLGTLRDGRVEPASFSLSATCTRVPVIEGHTEVIQVETQKEATVEAAKDAWRSFSGRPQELGLASAPSPAIVVHDEPDRPQPARDVWDQAGMSSHVGRVSPDPLTGGLRFVALNANTVRGASGASILNAELAVALGLIE